MKLWHCWWLSAEYICHIRNQVYVWALLLLRNRYIYIYIYIYVKEIKKTPIQIKLWRIGMIVCGEICNWNFGHCPLFQTKNPTLLVWLDLPLSWRGMGKRKWWTCPEFVTAVSISYYLRSCWYYTPKTLFTSLGHRCASHQVYPCLEHRTVLLVNVISVEGIHL